MRRNQYLLLVVGIALICAVTLGFSYAYWNNIQVQENPNVSGSKCFSIEFKEKEGSDINLDSAFPISDDEGMKLTPYEFTITNTCDMYAAYNINMEVLNTTTLSHDLIKAVIDDNTPKVATDYASATATINGATAYTLLSGGLIKDESRTYSFRMWVDSNATLENSQNKTVATKIVVTASAAKEPNLINTLLSQYEEGAVTGLVKDEINPNLYYYKGTNEQVSNNFLWYGGHQWRILEFDTAEKSLTLITQQPLTAISPTNTVWTTEEGYNSSYINSWLNDYFWNSLDDSVKLNILDTEFNVGNDVEKIITNKKVGLLDQTQYENAGGVDSFLDIKDSYWLLNKSDDGKIIGTDNNGAVVGLNYTGGRGVRPLIKINDLFIEYGDGSLKNNYRNLNFFKSIEDLDIGSYINIPYDGSDKLCGDDNLCVFRVVGKDNDSIKVILNGLLPSASQYGSTSKITLQHPVYESLNLFINGINSNLKFNGNKNYFIGAYPLGVSYEDVKSEYLSASIGMPVVGEMFSGNDLDLNYPASDVRIFVDVHTIENPNASGWYWLMNRYDDKYVKRIDYLGNNSNHSPTDVRGIRPVLFLKKGLKIIGGEGTAQNPYTLQ